MWRRHLVDRGADVKAADWYGRTPLWAAVETRNMDVDNGTFENGITREPYLELIKVLLDRGADPNARTKEVPRYGRCSCARRRRSSGWTSRA
jgi:ankyrin repeat protein